MSIELTYLVWSALLVVAYIAAQSLLYHKEFGSRYVAGPRDEDKQESSPLTGRGERALRNLLETYAVFVALALATEISGRSDGLTQWGAALYFWARWVYLPLYIAGIPYFRSLVWLVSLVGLALLFVGVAF